MIIMPITTAQIETWRPVLGLEGYYEVSDHGRVRNVERVVEYPATTKRSGHRRMAPTRIRKLHVGTGGYQQVKLLKRGVVNVHTLVLESFVCPRPDGLQACHEDGDPANNHLANLRWDTPKKNSADSIRHGRTPRGEKQGRSKLRPADIKDIRSSKLPRLRLAKKYGVTHQNIDRILKRETWVDV